MEKRKAGCGELLALFFSSLRTQKFVWNSAAPDILTSHAHLVQCDGKFCFSILFIYLNQYMSSIC